MKTSGLFLLFALSIAGAPRRIDTYPRQPGVDALHYVFRLTLSDSTDEILGEATADIRFTRDNVAELALDLMSVVDSSHKGMTVSEVMSGGATLKVLHQADRLRIPLTGVKAGERRQFTIKYHGVPGPGLRIGKNKYGDRTFFSLNWPDKARQWIPIIDHPGDKATSEFIVTAPVKYRVVSNGLLQEEREMGDGRRMTHWKQSVPIASWLNTIGVAQFATHHAGVVKGIELQTWAFPQDSANGPITFEGPARQAIEFYSENIGPYTYEKLANIQTAGLGGGTEHASAIAYGENSVKNQPATGLVAHEIAHQWFGDGVTERDWDDVWLSEGFATYFTLLFTEHYSGRDAFVSGLKRSRETVFRTEGRMPGKPVIHENLSNMREVLNQLVYQKGGWVLHMLRAQIGTENFWTGIRQYYQAYRDANASTDDLRRVMEEVSGQDLGWFFQQWLKRPGSPVVSGGWKYDPAAKKIEVDLAQTQSSDAYRLPLEIGITPDSGAVRFEKVEMNQKSQRFQISVDRAPTNVELDPNTWVLMDAKFVKR